MFKLAFFVETPLLSQQPTNEAKIFQARPSYPLLCCDRRSFDVQLRYLILNRTFGPAHLTFQSVPCLNLFVKGDCCLTPPLFPEFLAALHGSGSLFNIQRIQRLSLSRTAAYRCASLLG